MSDPVTNLAIEDVLSSIRRLVSEGDRSTKVDIFAQSGPVSPHAAAAPAPQILSQPPVIPDRFVLTPALRITEPVIAGPTVPGGKPAVFQLAPALHPAPPHLVKAESVAPESRSALEQRIAELEAAVADQPDEWEPDGSEGVPVVDWAAAQSADGFIFASRTMPHADRSGALDLGSVGTRIHPVIDEALATDDPTVAAADTTSQPYHLGEDLDLSGAGDADHDVAAYLQDPDQDTAPSTGPGAIDPEVLRQLVIDVVRQELQGALGERITRNVRKMVRREIFRVLSSQEFES
jgi:hypothetical protein